MARKKATLPAGISQRGDRYYADVYHNGKRYRKSLGKDLQQARQELLKFEAQLTDPLVPCPTLDLLRDVFTPWLESVEISGRPSTLLRMTRCVEHLTRLLPAKSVVDVTPQAVNVYRKRRLQETYGKTKIPVSVATANYEIAALKSALNWAVDQGKIPANPIARVKRVLAEQKAVRALTADETSRLLAVASPALRDALRGYLLTGMRRMELCNLQWRDVDMEKRTIRICGSRSKNRERGIVRINNELAELLEQRATRGEKYVFTNSLGAPLGNNILRSFKNACRRAGIETEVRTDDGRIEESVTLHSLRHTFATRLLELGVDPKTVQKLLRHKTIKVTMDIYAHSTPEREQEAVERLAEVIS